MEYSNRMMNSRVQQSEEKCQECGARSGHPVPSGAKCSLCGEPLHFATRLELHYGQEKNVDYCSKCRSFQPHREDFTAQGAIAKAAEKKAIE